VLFVHGAGSGPDVFDGWRDRFAGCECVSVDLQKDIFAGEASMADYARIVVSEGRQLPRPLALVGWSTGGLVAWMAEHELRPDALVLVEPRPPAELQGRHEGVPLESGTFDPKAVYGPFPPGMKARKESLLARSERKRGISVAVPDCPTLVVSGKEFADERGTAVAEFIGAGEVAFPELDHWDLVLEVRVVDAVADALGL
jgi:pimeloyl-ACP methyl ester carboxylesterase